MQKLLTFLKKKYIDIFQTLTFEILTKPLLTTSLVLNNQALIFKKKYIDIFQTLTFEILTKPLLTTSLVLNNQALISLLCSCPQCGSGD